MMTLITQIKTNNELNYSDNLEIIVPTTIVPPTIVTSTFDNLTNSGLSPCNPLTNRNFNRLQDLEEGEITIIDGRERNGSSRHEMRKRKQISERISSRHYSKRDTLRNKRNDDVDRLTKWYNRKISRLFKNGKFEEIMNCYHQMLNEGIEGDADTYHTIIRMLIKNEKWDDALGFFNQMPKKGIKRSTYIYNPIINGFFKIGNWQEAMRFYEKMCNEGIKGNTCTYNIIINGLIKNGKWDDALGFFNQMPEEEIKRNALTYNPIINGFFKIGNWQEAMRLYDQMCQKKIKENGHICCTIIDGLIKNDECEEAMRFFNQMCQKRIERNVYIYSSIIDGFFKIGNWQEAMRFYEKMCNEGIKENTCTYNIIINGLIKNEKWDDAMGFFNQMPEKGIRRNVFTYNPIIDGFFKIGNWQEAMRIYEKMRNEGIKGSTYTYNIIIDGFFKLNKPHLANKFYIEMLETCSLNKRKIKPIITTLINGLLCRLGEVKEAKEQFLSMSELYAQIPPEIIMCFINGLLDLGENKEAAEAAMQAVIQASEQFDLNADPDESQIKKSLDFTCIRAFMADHQYVKAFMFLNQQFTHDDLLVTRSVKIDNKIYDKVIDLRGTSNESAVAVLYRLINAYPLENDYLVITGRGRPIKKYKKHKKTVKDSLIEHMERDPEFSVVTECGGRKDMVIVKRESAESESHIIDAFSQNMPISTIGEMISELINSGENPSNRLYAAAIWRYVLRGTLMDAQSAYRKIKQLQWEGNCLTAASLTPSIVPLLRKHAMNKEVEDLNEEHSFPAVEKIKSGNPDDLINDLLNSGEQHPKLVFESAIYHCLKNDEVDKAHRLMYAFKCQHTELGSAIQNELLYYHLKKSESGCPKSRKSLPGLIASMEGRNTLFFNGLLERANAAARPEARTVSILGKRKRRDPSSRDPGCLNEQNKKSRRSRY